MSDLELVIFEELTGMKYDPKKHADSEAAIKARRLAIRLAKTFFWLDGPID